MDAEDATKWISVRLSESKQLLDELKKVESVDVWKKAAFQKMSRADSVFTSPCHPLVNMSLQKLDFDWLAETFRWQG